MKNIFAFICALFFATSAMAAQIHPGGAQGAMQFNNNNAFAGTGPTIFPCTGADQTTAITAALVNGANIRFTGTCKTLALAVSGITVTLDMAPGAVLEPAGSSDIDIFWQFTNSNVTILNWNVNGLGLIENAMKFINGTITSPNSNITMSAVGWPVDVATDITTGVWTNGVTEMQMGTAQFSGFSVVSNNVCNSASGIGAMRGIYLTNTGWTDIKHEIWSGGAVSGDNGAQIEPFHSQLGNTGGIVHNLEVAYNQNTRRAAKFQSGNWAAKMTVYKGSDFTPVSGQQIGLYNLNAVDWATNAGGSLTVLPGSYVDASAFSVGISNSGGTAQVSANNITLVGATATQTRAATVCNGALSSFDTIGFFATGTDIGSGISNSYITGFGAAVVEQGNYEYAINNQFVDPVDMVANNGTSSATDGNIFSGNAVRSITSGNLNVTRMIRYQNNTNVTVNNNSFEADGNATFATRFIDFTNAGATGVAIGNYAPAVATVVNVGSSTVTINLTNGVTTLPPAVVGTVVTPTISTATFATNVALGNTFRIGLIHASCPCTLSTPTNPVDGQVITYEIIQSATGSDTIGTYGTAFDFGTTGAPTLTTTANARDLLGFKYSGSSSKWNYLGSGLGF